jgi:hypothetical protein
MSYEKRALFSSRRERLLDIEMNVLSLWNPAFYKVRVSYAALLINKLLVALVVTVVEMLQVAEVKCLRKNAFVDRRNEVSRYELSIVESLAENTAKEPIE